jgi:hypothetical protein
VNAIFQRVFALGVEIWPRVIRFSDTPSLLALALVANLVALIPARAGAATRVSHDDVACAGACNSDDYGT